MPRLSPFPIPVVERPAPEETVTGSFGAFIHGVKPEQLSQTVLRRSKRMVLDSIGVGLLGSTTQVFQLALQHCQVTALHQMGRANQNTSHFIHE